MIASTRAAAPALIGASAGSGKTYRLTQVVTDAVDPASPLSIDLLGLVAVTYTQKGAAELGSRIRQCFAAKGAHETTHRLPLAYIGTVHSVCLRLVKEFAIDAGLSPMVDVASGHEDRLLRQALEWGLEPELRRNLDELAYALELRLDAKTGRVDWFTPVQDIMTLARSNRIAPAALPAMAGRSLLGLLHLLGPAEADGGALDRELLVSLREAQRGLERVNDGIKKTETAKDTLGQALKKAEAGRLKWCDWVRLQNLEPAKKHAQLVAPLEAIARRVDHHPRFQAQLRDLTLCMYEAARHGLEAYDLWKRRRRIIDFVDMLDRALSLLEHPEVRAELAERFELLVVDEFQDTSPIQLALFTRLHQLAGRSSWVGDRKQCIFEYAGADPELMESVAAWALAAGGSVEQLPHNWRSRPGLVAFSNALFSAAFARHGYAASEVITSAKRQDEPELTPLPCLGVWSLDVKNAEGEAAALAEGVARLLAEPSLSRVHDRATQQVRDARPGDIAVLVATNLEAERLAEALGRQGVFASIARAGLLQTPEGVLLTAALRWLLDPRSSLAAAQLEALTGFGNMDPDVWLGERVRVEALRRAAPEAGEPAPEHPLCGAAETLSDLRPELSLLSPCKAVDRVLARLDMATLCRRWPDPQQRVGNLDALRALAAEYEQSCLHNREAATIAGLLRFFDEAAQKMLIRNEELASDDQHTNTGPDAVTIVTYHRAKGLEWPIVILGSLDRPPRRNAFEVAPETDRNGFDPDDPLGSRWIRYWPWPFGAKKALRLWDVAAASPQGVAVAEREERERARLLYVGFTRARDHLILSARTCAAGYKTDWLEELRDGERALLSLPAAAQISNEQGVVSVLSAAARHDVAARCWALSGKASAGSARVTETALTWFAAGVEAAERVPYWIAPSRAGSEWPALALPVVSEVVSLGSRLQLGAGARAEWDSVGHVVHAFLAADVPELDAEERLTCARRLLDHAALGPVLAPEALVQAGDNVRTWVRSRWPDAMWRREVPVMAVMATEQGPRRVEGTIDLLLETPDGVILIDHKSYPGGQDTWAQKATEFAPQFAAYAEALRLAGRKVLEMWVTFCVAGGAVRLRESLTP